MKKSVGTGPMAFPTPVFVIGTYGKDGKANAMTASWAGICCSQPPCVYVSLREATYTFHNIMERKAFTISIPSEDHLKQADYFGLVSGRDEDKFKATGFTPVRGGSVDAPFVGEFPFVIECALFKTVPLGLHTQFIGEIKDIRVEDSCLTGGKPDMAKLKAFAFSPADRSYYRIGGFAGAAFSAGKEKP